MSKCIAAQQILNTYFQCALPGVSLFRVLKAIKHFQFVITWFLRYMMLFLQHIKSFQSEIQSLNVSGKGTKRKDEEKEGRITEGRKKKEGEEENCSKEKKKENKNQAIVNNYDTHRYDSEELKSFLMKVKEKSECFSSLAQSCLTLCNPMDCSTLGLPVHHQLPEFTQTQIH